MSHTSLWSFGLCFALAPLALSQRASARETPRVYLGYHWHLHQPLYWPERAPTKERVQNAAESIDLKAAGGGFYAGSSVPHPQNNLASGDIGSYDPVFGNDDRVRAYQNGGRDSIATLLGLSGSGDAGAQISYSGSLMDNVASLGSRGRYGYRPDWNAGYSEARHWKGASGKPRADLVGFTYHHALAPLLPRSVFRKELEIFKVAWAESWGGNPDGGDHSKGYFPTEAAFSPTLIPILKELGYEWAIVPANHLARTCSNYLDPDIAPMHSQSTWNTNPPNRADLRGPRVPSNQWWSGTLDGRGAKLPAPFAYQPHRARYIDPESGKAQTLVIVPMDDVQSYMNGYGTMGTSIIEQRIAPFSDPDRPSLVLFAHDGDNAWGGGYSYYFESVPGLSGEAASKGYPTSTIEAFLANHPVPQDDLTHIEDGGWINPEGDWGDPQFVKWLYPPARSPKDPQYDARDPRTLIDIENGFSSSFRSWAVIMAGANICETAEQRTGRARPDHVRDPSRFSDSSDAEKCWHFYLSGLDSGFMYYGSSLDDEVEQSLALNRALSYARPALDRAPGGAPDLTPPTMLRPQRFPHNPGGAGWGVTTRYQDVGLNGRSPYSSEFYLWTLAYDVSGIQSVTAFVRRNPRGVNALGTPNSETYAGDETSQPWVPYAMQGRDLDPSFKGDPPDPQLDFFILPEAIASRFWTKLKGYRDELLDYYIEAEDKVGNRSKSDIFHVWVGNGTPAR